MIRIIIGTYYYRSLITLQVSNQRTRKPKIGTNVQGAINLIQIMVNSLFPIYIEYNFMKTN